VRPTRGSGGSAFALRAPDERLNRHGRRQGLRRGKGREVFHRAPTSVWEASMQQSIVHVALVVRDYDEAIAFFCGKLHFTLVEDTYQPEQDKRWVLVAPPGSSGTTLLLARASTPAQAAAVGNQTGGRVFLFLATDDFWRDYNEMASVGIHFVREPKDAPYGTVAVFEDLYGNYWDLIQPVSPRAE
jgi:catechol 2,3-dioxygenase-like lactoylglutathione lyase family enzyme